MTSRVLVVPVRDFDTAKSRLSSVMTAQNRRTLARLCAERVLDRGIDCQRIIVCDSNEVEAWSSSLGAVSIRVSSSGLNEALTEAMPEIVSLHPNSPIVIAHGDIIEPSGLDDLIAGTFDLGDRAENFDVVIVPDSRHDGTNVLRLDGHVVGAWTFEYGPGSFTRHVHQADSQGWRLLVLEDEGLALDLDTPDDLLDPNVRRFIEKHVPELDLPLRRTRETESP